MHLNNFGKAFGLAAAAWLATKYFTRDRHHDEQQPQMREINQDVKQVLTFNARAGDWGAFNVVIDDYVDRTMSVEERHWIWHALRA